MTAPVANRRTSRTGRRACAAIGAVTVVSLAAVVVAGIVPARTGLLAVGCALGTASAMPVIRDTLRGRAQPPLVMWATWAALTGLAGAASLAARDYPSAVFALVGTGACTAVVVVAIHAGTWSPSRLEVVCLALILPGVGLWLTLNRPVIAVLTACLIDFIGVISALPTLWRRPDQQPALAFALISAGGICTACAAWGTWTLTAVAYPLYVAASTAGMALLSLPASRPAVRGAHRHRPRIHPAIERTS